MPWWPEQIRQGRNARRRKSRRLQWVRRGRRLRKEAFILTGYFNLAKVLELALNDGVDPRTAGNSGDHGEIRKLRVLRRSSFAPGGASCAISSTSDPGQPE